MAPEAYTKATLVEAFSWLQSQDDSIKQLVTNADVLAALYLKVKRHGPEVLKRLCQENIRTQVQSVSQLVQSFNATRPQSPVESKRRPVQRSGESQLTLENMDFRWPRVAGNARPPELGPSILTDKASLNTRDSGVSQDRCDLQNEPLLEGVDNQSLNFEESPQKSPISKEYNASHEVCESISGNKGVSVEIPNSLWESVQELSQQMGFSSSQECLRVLLQIGLKHLKRTLPSCS